jgi:nucleoside 2-deoxyribosyltransferase
MVVNKMLLYIAAPLFNSMEKEFNRKIDELIVSIGFKTYLPQRDGGSLAELVRQGGNTDELSDYIFNLDVETVKKCDILLLLLDGRVPDEGACMELGMAYALNKKCIGLKTDIRSFADGYDNLMIRKSFSAIFNSEDELIEYLKEQLEASIFYE